MFSNTSFITSALRKIFENFKIQKKLKIESLEPLEPESLR